LAKYRYLYCDYWTDSEVFDFTPEEKLFYVYILTNMHTSQCGIYHIPVKIIEVETGYSCETIFKLIDRFQNTYNKLRYNITTKELGIKNWAKHNNSSSPKVRKCIETEFIEIKDKSLIEYVYGIDMVSILNQKEEEKEKEEIKEEIKEKEEEKESETTTAMGAGLLTNEDVFIVYEKLIDKLTKSSRDKLNYFLKHMEPRVIVLAFEEARLYNKRSIKYVEAILNNWLKYGIKTMEDYYRTKGPGIKSKKQDKESDFNEFISK
jgi:DnaD/phage-associated family protein